MKCLSIVLIALFSISATAAESSSDSKAFKPGFAPDPSQILGGDEGTACEVLLCLSMGSPPTECDEPLKKYFDMKKKKRPGFLQKCPVN